MTGPGGVGKSRLALQLVRRELESRAGKPQLYFVALEDIISPEAIPTSLATAAGIPLAGKEEVPLERARYFDAVQPFVQRVRRASNRFALTAENIASVVKICRLLEGSPLGIELAAVWVRIRSRSRSKTSLPPQGLDCTALSVTPSAKSAPCSSPLRSVSPRGL